MFVNISKKYYISIIFFRIELFSSTTNTLVDSKTIESDQAIGGFYHTVFTNIENGEAYWAQVTVVFFVDTGFGDGYLEEGLPSPRSESVIVSKESEFILKLPEYPLIRCPPYNLIFMLYGQIQQEIFRLV